MASWLSQEWSAQIRSTLSKAATSVQRLAEQAEKDFQETGNQIRQSAQNLAEQGEAAAAEARAALKAKADRVAGNFSALAAKTASGEGYGGSEEEAVKFLQAEVKSISAALDSGFTPSAESPTELAVSVLRGWSIRLWRGAPPNAAAAASLSGICAVVCASSSAVADGQDRRVDRRFMKILLQSRALSLLLEVLANSPDGLAIIRAAVSEGPEDGATATSVATVPAGVGNAGASDPAALALGGAGRRGSASSDAGSSAGGAGDGFGGSGGDCGAGDDAASSGAGSTLGDGAGTGDGGSVADVQHLVARLSDEGACENEAENEAVAEAQVEAKVEAGRIIFMLLCAASQAPPALLVRLLRLVSEAAAVEASAADDDDELDLPPLPAAASSEMEGQMGEGSGTESEWPDAAATPRQLQWALSLLAAALTDVGEASLHDSAELRRRVDQVLASAEAGPISAVSNVEKVAQQPDGGESGAVRLWLQQLDIAEDCSQSFVELRKLCEELTISGVVPPGSAAAEVSGDQLGTSPASRSSAVSAGPGSPRSPKSPKRRRAASVLEALMAALSARREEGQRRAEALGVRAESYVSAGQGFQEQLGASSRGFEAELKSMQEEHTELQTQVDQLVKERDALREQLRAVEEKLAQVTQTREQSELRERQLCASARRVAGQLQEEMSLGEAARQRVAEQQQILLEAGAASSQIEALLTQRIEQVGQLDSTQYTLDDRQLELVSACLKAERARHLQLDKLLISWHAAVWGPGAEEMVRDAGRLAAMRGLHLRASQLIEQAWRETVQLAAQALGDEQLPSEASENMSQAAECYRQMRQQVQDNLTRLAKLEAVAATPRPLAQCTSTAFTFAAPVAGSAVAPTPSAAADKPPPAVTQGLQEAPQGDDAI